MRRICETFRIAQVYAVIEREYDDMVKYSRNYNDFGSV